MNVKYCADQDPGDLIDEWSRCDDTVNGLRPGDEMGNSPDGIQTPPSSTFAQLSVDELTTGLLRGGGPAGLNTTCQAYRAGSDTYALSLPHGLQCTPKGQAAASPGVFAMPGGSRSVSEVAVPGASAGSEDRGCLSEITCSSSRL